MTDLFETGMRPIVDKHLEEEAAKRRDYGNYWSASQAGYCMRKVIFDRLQIVPVVNDARKQRIFSVGHIFHEWLQRLTKEAGISIAQELELIDDELHIKGHFDDLVLVKDKLILYDYKTQNSGAFSWQKGRPMGHYHRMQLATYMYMLRRQGAVTSSEPPRHSSDGSVTVDGVITSTETLTEARVLKISKDDLRMTEQQLLWDSFLEDEVKNYWKTLNYYWDERVMPNCTCSKYDDGFMASEKYNPYFHYGQPCSIKWFSIHYPAKEWIYEEKEG